MNSIYFTSERTQKSTFLMNFVRFFLDQKTFASGVSGLSKGSWFTRVKVFKLIIQYKQFYNEEVGQIIADPANNKRALSTLKINK